ncbi:MAG: hypothetical protein R3B09_13545 [Nannocystaceae bacterium]
MASLDRKLRAYRGKYERVWYLADGVYSMFGDSAPSRGCRSSWASTRTATFPSALQSFAAVCTEVWTC